MQDPRYKHEYLDSDCNLRNGQMKNKKMVMKVTNIYKHEIVDTRA